MKKILLDKATIIGTLLIDLIGGVVTSDKRDLDLIQQELLIKLDKHSELMDAT